MKRDKVDKGRRRFLKLGLLAGAGLTVGGYLYLGGEEIKPASRVWAEAGGSWAPNAWLRVDEEGLVTVRVNHTEMGQGITTALAMIVAEELEADWNRIRVEMAPAESVYKNPAFNTQMTAASTSVRTSWDILRRAGAAAREMLLAAAAREWKAPKENCRAEKGRVYDRSSARSLDYGALASRAARIPVPENPPLKRPDRFRIIGRNVHRLDSRVKSQGRAVFGLDVRLPNMVRAAMVHPPILGAKLIKVHDRRARQVKGVREVIPLERAVAVVAETTWQALEGAQVLETTWDRDESPAMDTEELYKRWPGLLQKKGKTVYEKGEEEENPTGSGPMIKAAYRAPYQAHATPEPMNCTALVREDGCDVWAPTQHQDAAQEAAARITGLPYKAVNVRTTFVGGGFGRRISVEYVEEAVALAKMVGAPVQVVWSREEDMRNDRYRPATFHALQATLDDRGLPENWIHRIVGPDHMTQMMPILLPSMMPYGIPRGVRNLTGSLAKSIVPRFAGGKKAVEGAAPLPYDIGRVRVDFIEDDPGIPTGFWRSVAHSQNAFAVESFVDEIAQAADRDPVELRLAMLRSNPDLAKVLDLAAEKSGWGGRREGALHLGAAVHDFHHTLLAFVAQVSVSPTGRVRVDRVVCALDCGVAINPRNIAAQMRSGIVFGLTATLKGSINIQKGRVREGNFDDFPLLTMDEMPKVEVHIMPSTRPPTGIGEAAVPLIAPAVTNAIFAATGKRVRSLPVEPSFLGTKKEA